MCFFMDNSTIHWLQNIERGAGFMGKDVWFGTYWVWSTYDTAKCAYIMYSSNITSSGLICKFGFDFS